MSRRHWLNSLFFCFGGSQGPPPPTKSVKLLSAKAVLQIEEIHSASPVKLAGDHELVILLPILWSYLSAPERLAIRSSCREGLRVHDSLVTNIYICDDSVVLSAIPAARLPRWPLPTLGHAKAQQVVTTLQGFVDRGCQPHLLLICLAEGHERRRHEDGLAVLTSLTAAAGKLSVVHLCGVPLTPQVARALKALLPAPSGAEPVLLPAPSISTSSAPPVAMWAPPQAPSICTASAPLVSAMAAPSLASSSAAPTPRSLTAVSHGPTAAPLSLSLYGYDLVRQPAAVAAEMLIGAAAPRLTRLQLWGCVGWPKRMGALLHGCAHLRHFTIYFKPLIPPDGIAAASATAAAAAVVPEASSAAQRAAAALASGAVIAFPPIAAAITAAAVVKTLGSLYHLRSLELRGCTLNVVLRTSSEITRGGAAAVRPRPGVASKAAAERAAVAAAAPSVQQLSCALYQLTRLTRLAIDGLNTAAPLLTAVAAMRGLLHLELPDAAAPAATDLAAIARAAPRLVSLTLGSVGPGSVLDAGGNGAGGLASTEVLPLPPALEALRIARCRPTLRTMRALRRTVEARAALPAAASMGAAAAAGDGGGEPPPRILVVVPGIEIDMLDVEFDALQGFSRGSDGVLRSALLPESAEALVAAIRLLVPPPQQQAPGGATAAIAIRADVRAASDVGGGVAAGPSFGGGGSGSYVAPPFGGGPVDSVCLVSSSGYGGGHRCASTFSGYSDVGSTIAGGGGGVPDGADEGPPTFGSQWTRELTIHNAQGSLAPPPPEEGQQQREQREHLLASGPPLERLPEGAEPAELQHGAAGPVAAAAEQQEQQQEQREQLQQASSLRVPLAGHAVWILEMRPLGLLALELYGIGVQAGDLEALMELVTLRRLTLASGELEVDGLPCLAALPLLEYLELSRCTPCRHRRRGGGAGGGSPASTGAGFTRASGTGGAGGGFARGSATVARVSVADSDAAAADGDGEVHRPSGKRALLELCMTAPRLRKVLIVRCTGMVSRMEGAEGPLGAEWVRQRLLAAGPRYRRPASAATAVAPLPSGGEAPMALVSGMGRLSRMSGLGRRSRASGQGQVTEAELGWPEVRWD